MFHSLQSNSIILQLHQNQKMSLHTIQALNFQIIWNLWEGHFIIQMGNSTFGEAGSHPSRFRKIGTAQLYHLGQVQLYQDQLSRQEVIKPTYEFALDSDREDEFIHKIRSNNNKCPYLVNIQKIQVQSRSGCTHSNHLFHIYFQYLPMTLAKLLTNYKKPLPDREVRLLVGCLLEAVREMNERQTYHGDIYPQFIYLDERGQRRYKIFDSAYFNPLKHGYYRAFSEATFCSPQMLSNISQRKNFPIYNFYISDTFSIGLVALYAMTNINPTIAYTDTASKQIDYYYIENLLRIATQKGYSEYLLCCIEECVKLKDRPNASDLLEYFPQLQVNHTSRMSRNR